MRRKGISTVLVVLALAVLAGCGVDPAERNNTGNALYGQGDFAGAVDVYELALVAAPDEPVSYYNIASALAMDGDLERAVLALEQALKTSDTGLQAQAYYNLGNVYMVLGDFADAVSAYQQTLLRQPDDANARYNLELALRQITPLPDESGGGETTPTPESTESPEATPDTGDSPTATPTPENALSPADAERLLDSAAQNQDVLSELLLTETAPLTDDTPQKDW
ncbi:MAG: tetratricopeptide repeat protein [Anaerolineaceae bacterium]|nr:tetratricopeptide repeat protein [Anaerolineaceae bacterium]